MKKGLVFSIILLVFSIFCCTTIRVPQKDIVITQTDGAVPKRTAVNQNWDDKERKKFWFTSQGSQIIPYTWFTHLEQPDNNRLFRNSEHIEELGYLPADTSDVNPSGLPIGFTMTRTKSFEDSYLGLTCAACHTNQLDYKGEKFLIDGAPTLGNFVLFYDRLVNALDSTRNNNDKFTRFANKVLPKRKTPDDIKKLKKSLKTEVVNAKLRRKVNALPPDYPKDFTSYGRLDAFGNIANAGSAFALEDATNRNPPTAPVSYPFLWGSHQSDVVQWNASATNKPRLVGPLVRNMGEVVGVFGGLELKKAPWYMELLGLHHRYKSTVDFQGLGELEGLVANLRSPRWDSLPFPKLDPVLLNKGQLLFKDSCASCHHVVPLEDEDEYYIANRTLVETLGTDKVAATNIANDMVKTLFLEGEKALIVKGDRFGETTRSINIALNGVAGIAVSNIRKALKAGKKTESMRTVRDKGVRDQLEDIYEYQDSVAESLKGLVYKGRPLNGIWATAPFLHNGSVPTLWDLLQVSDNRPTTFWVGHREFDPVKVGYRTEVGKNEFKVLKSNGEIMPGNSNRGHEFGTALDEADKWALLEYLKSL